MALRKLLRNLTAPVERLDEDRLREFCGGRPEAIPISEAKPRQVVTVVGEILTTTIVPRPDGAPWLDVVITDGTGKMVVRWTGRRKIPGIKAGQRLVLSGRGSNSGPGGRLLIYNPRYELL